MKRLRLWGVIALGSLIAVTAPVLLLKNWLSGSASGKVTTGAPIAHQQTLPKAPDFVHVDTAYFNAVLPAGFAIKRNIATPNTPLTQLQFAANTSGTTDQQVAITIGQLPPGGMTQQGDYNLRVTDTTDYQPLAISDLPAGATAFAGAAGAPAFTIFWSHGPQYAEIALSTDGAASLSALQSTASQLLADWNWH